MYQIITSNPELITILCDNGLNIICDEKMRMVMNREDANKVPHLVKAVAPAAIYDYVIVNA